MAWVGMRPYHAEYLVDNTDESAAEEQFQDMPCSCCRNIMNEHFFLFGASASATPAKSKKSRPGNTGEMWMVWDRNQE